MKNKNLMFSQDFSPAGKFITPFISRLYPSSNHGATYCILFFFMLGLLLASCLITPVNASLGFFKQNTCVNIRVLSNCSNVNLTEVSNHNITFIINKAMNKIGGQTFNYTFCNTSENDIYSYSWYPDCYDCSINNCGNSFVINPNGRENASDNVTLFFIVIFLAIIGLSGYIFLYSLGHFISLDFDLIDLSINFGFYFVVIALYFLQNYYVGNSVIDYYLLLFVKVGGILFILIPGFAFILNLTYGAFVRKKIIAEAPRRIRFRR